MTKATLSLWYDHDAEGAAAFYAATFPDSRITGVHHAPDDYPDGKKGQVLMVNFTICGLPCTGVNGGPRFTHSEAFSVQIETEDQAETDRIWNAILDAGGSPSQCGWCKDAWGISWQIIPKALGQALSQGGAVAERVFAAMMEMEKIDLATIEAAVRGA
jgi:predicted 3-demethylubiquinone-9 3-methyltransferase (glyoxalase superfamily)